MQYVVIMKSKTLSEIPLKKETHLRCMALVMDQLGIVLTGDIYVYMNANHFTWSYSRCGDIFIKCDFMWNTNSLNKNVFHIICKC